ncbi:exonuclease SbcCD subunit D C-terminal domain-containing protein [Nonlabens antarcticus]|uniref:exonuclease SbcCD subunit D C-terminal domain-containing protein n=1 Tax=Nonlabens antarcticus TaxID=392714 RepID=UPI00189163A2|nr:exonuclease SbcCD subunit D C-terminal domain-containing protein [Nonlabens antarcticus]
MKILHTADWHIGKKLYKKDLYQDFDLFIEWLCSLVKTERIEVILVSGDIYDISNPSSEARSQYYRTLLALRDLKCKIIITGGNHDSPSVLNAPKEILKQLDIDVIGGLPEQINDTLIPIKNELGKVEAVVAAIPFIRDADLRNMGDAHDYDSRLIAIREGITAVFKEASDLCALHYEGIPAIAMGHLYAAGVSTSESEREIQIGNLASFEADNFGDYFSYVALGHIHKPQQLTTSIPTYYSGSPLPLSFSESQDLKRVLIFDLEDHAVTSVEIPVFRKLIRIKGELEHIKQKLQSLEVQTGLNSFIEIELQSVQHDANLIYELDQLVSQFECSGYEIVKQKISFSEKAPAMTDFYQVEQELENLSPQDVFLKLLEKSTFEPEMKNEIISSFQEILEEVNQGN